MLIPGTVLGPYEIVAQVGAGGMGEVYRARDTRLGREVAIKVLSGEFAAEPERLRRFEQEARAVAALNHPNILVVHDVGTHEGSPYLVEELLDGESLRERLRSGPLPPRKAVELAVQACAGLAAAHERGIVHRDLKPENLFVTSVGHVKILDFGVAKLVSPREGEATVATALETEPGMVMGTVAYMSPEQVRGKVVDQRSDVFSLGCVLYEMVTGRQAFARGTAADTVSAILKEEPQELTATDPKIPASLARIVQHCLEKNPSDRFQSVRDLAFDLGALTASGSTPAAAVGAHPGKRARALAAAGVGFAAAALAAGFFFIGRVTQRPPQPPTFTRLTFQRGTIGVARFTPDGRGVVYGAAWDGRSPEVFETQTDLSTSRTLGLVGVSLESVSRSGELALRKQAEAWGLAYGPLAVVPASGSAPRDLLEDVSYADWSPQGSTLAVVRRSGGEDRLEMPAEHVLVKMSGYLADVRVSPDGRRIAFTEHPVVNDDRGTVAVVDLAGRKATLTGEFFSLAGLAWSPDGREIWFSAGAKSMHRHLYAVTPEGRLRTLARFPSSVVLHDVAPDGHVLLASTRLQSGIRGSSSAEGRERELGWLDFPWPSAISADGTLLLLDDVGETAGPTYTTYLRKMDGSAPVRLGEGHGCALSPDGRWVLALHYGPPQRLLLMPTGSGATVSLPRGPVETYQAASFLPDGERILLVGAEHDRPSRTWVQELGGGPPSPVTPEGAAGVTTSPDGHWAAVVTRDSTLTLFPLQGGEPKALVKLASTEEVRQWSKDGRTLFISHGGAHLDVFAIDVQSAERRLWRTFEPPDPAGVRMNEFVLTRDAQSYAYGYLRVLDELYVVEGLR